MTLRYRELLTILIVAVTITGSCVMQSPDTDPCTRRIDISFYSRSRCAAETSYPGAVTGFLVCVFDKDNTLAAYRTAGTANLDSAYLETFELPEGLYTVEAWTGLEEEYLEIFSPEEGSTTKNDLLIRLHRQADTAVETTGMMVMQGESPAFYAAADGEGPVTTSVNLLEVTNRLTITVSGLPDGGEGYEITVESDNGSMNIDGTIAQDATLIHRPVEADAGTGVLAADFTLLKLETGHTYDIVITNTVDGTELYRGSLLGALILKNPQVDLRCDHDFIINFTAMDQCACDTYMITEIWVNNWLVHSYSTDF